MDFTLIETLRFEPETGFARLNLHLARLHHSGKALGFNGLAEAEARLRSFGEGLNAPHRVRLELFADGTSAITAAPFTPQPETTVWSVKIARTATLFSKDPLLRHKTSRRAAYDRARAEFSKDEADEVLLLNEKGELCEGAITNLFVDDGSGRLLTPPLSCGLLAGVLRTSLLCARKARVQILKPEDLQGRIVYIGNSLRGLIRARLK
jgi:4-amino-4-deoxychorismate lyase